MTIDLQQAVCAQSLTNRAIVAKALELGVEKRLIQTD